MYFLCRSRIEHAKAAVSSLCGANSGRCQVVACLWGIEGFLADLCLFFFWKAVRRKNKEEASRDGSRNSQESIDETKKAGRAMSSPDWKHQELSFTTDGSAKKDSRSRSHNTTVSSKKNTSGASTEGENSCQSSFEACGQNLLSIKSSPRDVLDDVTPRTLPGMQPRFVYNHSCCPFK